MAKPKSNVEKLRDNASNLPGKEILEEQLKKLKLIDDRLAQNKSDYMTKNKAVRNDKAEIIAEMQNRGLDSQAIEAYHSYQKDLKKADKRRAKLSEDSQPIFDHIHETIDMFGDNSTDTPDKAPAKKATK